MATKEKMKVKLTQGFAGHRTRVGADGKQEWAGDFSHLPGAIVEIDPEEGKKLVERGAATIPTARELEAIAA